VFSISISSSLAFICVKHLPSLTILLLWHILKSCYCMMLYKPYYYNHCRFHLSDCTYNNLFFLFNTISMKMKSEDLTKKHFRTSILIKFMVILSVIATFCIHWAGLSKMYRESKNGSS
jgi:hypothetical protein